MNVLIGGGTDGRMDRMDGWMSERGRMNDSMSG